MTENIDKLTTGKLAGQLVGVNPRTGAPIAAPFNASTRETIERLRLAKVDTIFFWGNDLSENQLAIWVDYINESSNSFAVMAAKRTNSPSQVFPGLHFKRLKRHCVFLEDGFALEWISLLPDLKAIIYPTDKNRNFDLIRAFPNLIHVYAHHGDSVKHSSSNRLPAAYDFMLLPDEAATIQYIRGGIQLNTDRMLVMGNYVLPRLNVSSEHCSFKNLLYAPTFEGHSEGANFSSIAEITDHLIDWAIINGGFLFKPHDGTGIRIHDFKKIVELLHKISNNFNITDKSEIFNNSDFIVSDVSGIISEYIYTNKPIIVPISKKLPWKYNYIKSSSIAKYCYFWNYDEITLSEFIKTIENDPLRSAREKRRDDIYPQIMSQEDSIKLFDKAITYVHTTFEFRRHAHPKIFHI